MTEYNGGLQSYADRVTQNVFFRAEGRETKTVTLTAGQVVKALTPLVSTADGKYVVYSGNVGESAIVTLNANLANTETVILAGVTGTASGVVTPTQFAAGYLAYVESGTTAGTNIIFSGTFTGWTVVAYDDDSLEFTSTSYGSNATDLAATGTASAKVTLVNTTGTTSLPKLAGFAVYDSIAKDATGSNADTEIAVYSEASFWADAIVWAADPAQDFVYDITNTAVACTTFNTGAAGTASTATEAKLLRRLRNKIVEGTEFDYLGHYNIGDIY